MPMDESAYLVPTTPLQAVNVILEAMSQTPIASLDATDTNVDAETALQTLLVTSRELQEEGWHWNTEMEFPMDPNEDTGFVVVPANTLKVKRVYWTGTGGDDKDLILRGTKLYDRTGHTYNIGITVKADIQIILPFDEMPEAARRYVTAKAARRVATSKLKSSETFRFTKADEDEARTRLEQADAETDQRTLKGNPHIQRMRRR